MDQVSASSLEALEKAAQTADLLVQDLVAFSGDQNPLLADLSLDLLTPAGAIRQRLERLLRSAIELRNRSEK